MSMQWPYLPQQLPAYTGGAVPAVTSAFGLDAALGVSPSELIDDPARQAAFRARSVAGAGGATSPFSLRQIGPGGAGTGGVNPMLQPLPGTPASSSPYALRNLTSGAGGPAAQAARRGIAADLGSALSASARSSVPGAGTAAARTAATAAAESGAGGLGARLAAKAGLAARGLNPRSLMSPFNPRNLTAGSLARGALWGLGSQVAGGLTGNIAGRFGASQATADDLSRMAQYGVLGAGVGSAIPGVGTVLGGALGTGVGALGFIPGIEDVPVIGGLWGGSSDGGRSNLETLESIRKNNNNILRSMGADDAFINRANRQLSIALQVNNPDPDKEDFGAYGEEDLRGLGVQILEGMIQQFGMEQANAQSQQQLGGGFDSALAEIMAVQAQMAPLIQQQTATSQRYADQYAAAAQAAAAQIGDPALAAAGAALGAEFSANQASANQLAMQQLMTQPQAWQSALEQQYNEQMLALQQQQFQMQQQQAQMGSNYGLAPGLYPVG